ncbi:MAG: DUF547 domain-containing protein [Myxococcota bacterium]|nr:DUF547 domain-containing protein [Myxococcota bacterium]
MKALMITLMLFLAGCFSTNRLELPPGTPIKVEKSAFPHAVFDSVLKKVVNERGQVNYKALFSDRSDLERYMYALQEYSPFSHPALFQSKTEKLAYWINAYNASVLYGVTQRPSMKSVIDVKYDFFYFTKYSFGGRNINLYDLENEIIRKTFNEPRIHMALNCASIGCPELPREAFIPVRLEEQLTREAIKFCNQPKNIRMNNDKAEVSEIFEFYKEDFPKGPVKFCMEWGNKQLPAEAEWTYIPYDWSMNSQPGKAIFNK